MHIGWLDEVAANGERTSQRYADVAMVQAAIEAYDSQFAIEETQCADGRRFGVK